MATGVKRKPTNGGLYQAYFTDYTGKRKYFTARTRSEAKHEAARLEAEHRLIRQGIRPAPSSADRHQCRPFRNAVEEYLAWGRSQGGLKGRPWNQKHAHNKTSQLTWWQNRLGFEVLGDLTGVLGRVEKELRSLQSEGRTGKTVSNYANTLRAFCEWCIRRGYLESDPLDGLAPFDTTPRTLRRAMTLDEITRLLEVSPPERRLLYETALFSGLRANELRNLTVDHLDAVRGGLRLDAEWTKNRKEAFQPLPSTLIKKLQTFGASDEPERLYDENLGRGASKREAPIAPLLYVPSQPARVMSRDLKAAGIPEEIVGSKLDFHALRTAFVNLVFEFGQVSPKEAQDLARHSTPELTFNVYGRSRKANLANAIERVAQAVLPPKRVPEEYRLAVGSEQKNATPLKTKELRLYETGSGGRTRTYDKVVNSHPLCQLSYAGPLRYSTALTRRIRESTAQSNHCQFGSFRT